MRHRTLQAHPRTHAPADTAQEALRGTFGQGKAGAASRDSRADGTPAALTGGCFTHWGPTALGSAALRAAGPSSDHSHLLSCFFSRFLPAGRLFLTVFPTLQPSPCLKLLLFEEQP